MTRKGLLTPFRVRRQCAGKSRKKRVSHSQCLLPACGAGTYFVKIHKKGVFREHTPDAMLSCPACVPCTVRMPCAG